MDRWTRGYGRSVHRFPAGYGLTVYTSWRLGVYQWHLVRRAQKPDPASGALHVAEVVRGDIAECLQFIHQPRHLADTDAHALAEPFVAGEAAALGVAVEVVDQ